MTQRAAAAHRLHCTDFANDQERKSEELKVVYLSYHVLWISERQTVANVARLPHRFGLWTLEVESSWDPSVPTGSRSSKNRRRSRPVWRKFWKNRQKGMSTNLSGLQSRTRSRETNADPLGVSRPFNRLHPLSDHLQDCPFQCSAHTMRCQVSFVLIFVKSG